MGFQLGTETFNESLGKITEERVSVTNNVMILAMPKDDSGDTSSEDNVVIDLMGVTMIVTLTGQITGTVATIATNVQTLRNWVDNPDTSSNGKTYISDIQGNLTDGDERMFPMSFDGTYSVTSPFTYNYTLTTGRGKPYDAE